MARRAPGDQDASHPKILARQHHAKQATVVNQKLCRSRIQVIYVEYNAKVDKKLRTADSIGNAVQIEPSHERKTEGSSNEAESRASVSLVSRGH